MRDEFLRLRQAGHDLTHDIADGPLSSCHHEFLADTACSLPQPVCPEPVEAVKFRRFA